MLPTPSDGPTKCCNFVRDIIMLLPPRNIDDDDNSVHSGEPCNILARLASKGLNLVPQTAAPVASSEPSS